MQTRQLDVLTNTKTSDNVTVSVKTAIMYHVDPENVDTFYFKLDNPHQQITAYVDDRIRSQVHRGGLGCFVLCVRRLSLDRRNAEFTVARSHPCTGKGEHCYYIMQSL